MQVTLAVAGRLDTSSTLKRAKLAISVTMTQHVVDKRYACGHSAKAPY
jgi:hypothetical protein